MHALKACPASADGTDGAPPVPMRTQTHHHKVGVPHARPRPLPARSGALVSAALCSGVLWLGAVVAAGRSVDESTLLALGVAGLLVTVALLLLLGRQHSQLRGLAETDALTGLVNHRGFHDTLVADISRSRDLERTLALVMIDLDDFQGINDLHGHAYGDAVLREVARALRGAIRVNDTTARVGGEEFALILPGADAATALAVAERAREQIASIPVRGTRLAASAGIASFPRHAEEPGLLVQLAECAMRWAKESGRDRVRRFDPDHSPATWSERQRAEMGALLERDPVVPRFQPIACLTDGSVIGYEALARILGSSRRAPDVWLAQAHGCGLGAEFEAAAIRAARSPSGRPAGTFLAVNVSPSALLTKVVRDSLAGDLENIVVEITEHEFVADDQLLRSALADLRLRGARIAIDDAGAGHAGLKQLMRIRPDIVKLDKALIRNIQTDPARMALVESFVRFARDVGATVCAEGIESLDELAVLADLDVQWGQGFALGRPSEPWPEITPEAADLCRASLAETFRSLPVERYPTGASDRRLVHVSAKLASARTRQELESVMALIAAELSASKVSLSAWHASAAVLETLAETGDWDQDELYAIDDYPLSARVLSKQEAVQVVAGDPGSDPREVTLLLSLGQRSLLMVPVVSRGEALGIVEAYRIDERAWTRAEINRARVIASQFASMIPILTAKRTPLDTTRLRVTEGPLRASAERGTRA